MDNDINTYIKSNSVDDTLLLHANNMTYINIYKKDIIKDIIDLCYCCTNENEIDIKKSISYYVNAYVENYINNFLKNTKIYESRKKKVVKLKNLKLPEQRSIEWFNIRKKVLTASSLASALNKCHYKSRDELILDKINNDNKPLEFNPITEWGVKYEEIATKFYEHINNVKILEFGMVPHPKFPIFGASPDGICCENSRSEYIGRMLEIKCPPKRKFTKSVPKNYMYQMQGQLECCDLDECDFLQVKVEEYETYDNYLEKLSVDQIGVTNDNFPCGCVVTYKKLFSDKLNYLYPELYKSKQYYEEWEQNQKDWIKNNDHEYYETKWWFISRYECTLVKRDQELWNSVMPEIIKFWKDVEFYKIDNNKNDLIKIVESKKFKYPVTIINTKECLID